MGLAYSWSCLAVAVCEPAPAWLGFEHSYAGDLLLQGSPLVLSPV